MKKLFVSILFMLMLLFICVNSYAANTVKFVSPTIEISSIDSDWLYTTLFTGITSKINIVSIKFIPGATNDRCIILDTNASGPAIYDYLAADVYDQHTEYYPNTFGFMPFLDFSVGTYSSGSKVIIILGK